MKYQCRLVIIREKGEGNSLNCLQNQRKSISYRKEIRDFFAEAGETNQGITQFIIDRQRKRRASLEN